MTVDIALAASARDWPDRIHRYLLDHGGGRVVTRVMGPEQAVEDAYDVLLIDDICSFLSPRLVTVVKLREADVIGVYSPSDGSDAKRRLLECGISDVIETEASAEEFLQKINSNADHRVGARQPAVRLSRTSLSIGVTGPAAGVGISEVAVTLAHHLSRRGGEVCLLDLDPHWPSAAQRLDLPVHPNMRTAIDRVMHDPERVEESIHRIGGLAVVGGVADNGRGSPISHVHATMLFDSVAPLVDVVVADLGPYDRSITGATRTLDTLLVVGTGDPIGVARLLRTIDSIQDTSPSTTLLVIVNKTPGKRFHNAEVRREIADAHPTLPIITLPFDRLIATSSWEGTISDRGAFSRSVSRIAKLVSESLE